MASIAQEASEEGMKGLESHTFQNWGDGTGYEMPPKIEY
jgi:hypothetical protein